MAEKKTALKLIVGTAAIDKAIASVKNRGAKLDADIQLAGLSILAHIDQHGDTTLADRLFNAMPKGARRLALAEWFVTFGKVAALAQKTDAEAIGAGRVFGYAKDRTTDMEGAGAKPWHECRKEAAPAEVFDVQAAFHALMKRIENAKSKGIKLEHADMVERLMKVEQAPA